MECLVGNGLDEDGVNPNNRNISSLSSELPFSPFLAKLFLQENNSLAMIPPSSFQHMPVLQVLDLSHTSIQYLPPSISRLYLLEKLILQECSLLMEVPPEVGVLKNLKLFDLEGTELMYLPKEIGKLETLECLRVSLSAYADDHKDRYGIQYIIPRMMISKLSKLKELSISVDPEAEWWEVELLEAIMGDLPFLPEIKSLKLYLPTDKALQQFLKLERFGLPIYSTLWNYKLIIGHCEQLPLSVQLDTEENFLKLEKCVKYMNGEGCTEETLELIRDARALYIRRHWTVEKLSEFDTKRLKHCLLMECNEMHTLVDQGDYYELNNKSRSHSEDEILGSLQYLSIHFMKKLQSISKGQIGRNCLSCLRILALHTCPKLTSIFTGCLLDNMQSLTELIVEDCPKIKCLVDIREFSPCSNGPFLSSLRRVSLIDLPELVSISGGVCIAPQLDTLLVFNCMKLDYLSDMEIPRSTKAIKAEIEWWDALKYGRLTWDNVFVQLERDGGLMDQLAADTNSLKRLPDLEMDLLELNHDNFYYGGSSQVDQKSLTDCHLGCNYVSTKEDPEHVDPLRIESVSSSSELIQKTEDTDCDIKDINHKQASVKKKHRLTTVNFNDGFSWRKYGQKEILGDIYPRGYYRCTYRQLAGCMALKQVQRSTEDPSLFEVVYKGEHTCSTVLTNNCSSTATKSACRPLRTRDSPTGTESTSIITDDSHFDLPKRPQVVETDKKNTRSTRNTKWISQVKDNAKRGSEIPPDDGYMWRKYGHHDILGAEYSTFILQEKEEETSTGDEVSFFSDYFN